MGLKMKKLRFVSSKKKNEERKRVMKNGSILLQELIADSNGISVPIRSFSSSQIKKATNNFAYGLLVKHKWDDKWYKGIIDDKPYLIRRLFFVKRVKEAYNDIVLSARMSNHNNFLKLIGCCFEFSFPVYVFEYAEHRALNEDGRIVVNGEESILPWSVRLKIAKEIAIAVTYLHTAFSKMIIHRDIKLTNIFLDKNLTAKLFDFSISITLPEGKSRMQVDHVQGTYRYLDPLYLKMGLLTEYTDVYSFGICLLVFLIGRSDFAFCMEPSESDETRSIVRYVKGLYEKGKLEEVIDPMMAKDITSGQRLQVEECVVLALRCCEESDEDRPKMIQVSKELKRIQRSQQPLDADEITEQLEDDIELTGQLVDANEITEQSLIGIEITEQSVDATSGLSEPEMQEDWSSIIKWTRRFGFKIEIILILCFCITGFLMALLFR